MQTTTPLASALPSIAPMLLVQVSGGCHKGCCPPLPSAPVSQGETSLGDSTGGGGDSVSIVINGVPQAAQR